MNYKNILKKLPYTKPFLFVDELLKVNENSAEGRYTFPVDSFFYKGHFKNNPVTPGVILTECMAQIGVVSLGIFLLLVGFGIIFLNLMRRSSHPFMVKIRDFAIGLLEGMR
ncbi:MAG: hypothetical protein R3206_09910, partial [Salegentibacter mishustinae]|nr:hypothetical protein [Salegentibacter mishustinae]